MHKILTLFKFYVSAFYLQLSSNKNKTKNNAQLNSVNIFINKNNYKKIYYKRLAQSMLLSTFPIVFIILMMSTNLFNKVSDPKLLFDQLSMQLTIITLLSSSTAISAMYLIGNRDLFRVLPINKFTFLSARLLFVYVLSEVNFFIFLLITFIVAMVSPLREQLNVGYYLLSLFVNLFFYQGQILFIVLLVNILCSFIFLITNNFRIAKYNLFILRIFSPFVLIIGVFLITFLNPSKGANRVNAFEYINILNGMVLSPAFKGITSSFSAPINILYYALINIALFIIAFVGILFTDYYIEKSLYKSKEYLGISIFKKNQYKYIENKKRRKAFSDIYYQFKNKPFTQDIYVKTIIKLSSIAIVVITLILLIINYIEPVNIISPLIVPAAAFSFILSNMTSLFIIFTRFKKSGISLMLTMPIQFKKYVWFRALTHTLKEDIYILTAYIIASLISVHITKGASLLFMMVSIIAYLVVKFSTILLDSFVAKLNAPITTGKNAMSFICGLASALLSIVFSIPQIFLIILNNVGKNGVKLSDYWFQVALSILMIIDLLLLVLILLLLKLRFRSLDIKLKEKL